MYSRDNVAIVMRTFWPVSPIVGAGMLRVSEELAINHRCTVITQNQGDIYAALKANSRGKNVRIIAFNAFSTSSSHFLIRVLDLAWFSITTFATLLYRRPKLVYVSTDPPLLVPFIVYLYAKIFKSRYIYHVQDIHPEITSIAFPSLNGWCYKFLKKLDTITMSNASAIITLTYEMKTALINRRSKISLNVHLINNPSAKILKCNYFTKFKKYHFCFVGNAGRLQILPLVIASIQKYLTEGGKCTFAFAGSGVFQEELRLLSNRFPKNVYYFGKVNLDKATEITLSSTWAMLPINDDACKFAFPSKASTYALSRVPIICICSDHTNVAKWVFENNLGKIIPPKIEFLVSFFRCSENKPKFNYIKKAENLNNLDLTLSENTFVHQIQRVFNNELRDL